MSWAGQYFITQLLEGWKLQLPLGTVLSPRRTIVAIWMYGAEWGWRGFLPWFNNAIPDMF